MIKIVKRTNKCFTSGRYRITIAETFGGTNPRATKFSNTIIEIDSNISIKTIEDFFITGKSDNSYFYTKSISNISKIS